MKNYFFGFDTYLKNPIDWFFNVNHLFLILFVIAFIVGACFLLHAKSEKGKKITKLSLASLLFLLEIGRIIYEAEKFKFNTGSLKNFGWWWAISFQMCAIMTWTTIITLVLSAFLKKENKFLQILYNILFGCAMIGGILTFTYPDCLDSQFPFLHFINIQTILVHSLLIFVPIYLIKIKEFKVDIKNCWKPVIGYAYIGSVAMTASLISGKNFAYCLDFNLFDLPIPFPWHLPVVMLVLMSLVVLIYAAFELTRFLKKKYLIKKGKVENNAEALPDNNKTSKFGIAMVVVSNFCAIFFCILSLLVTASLIKGPKTMLGLLCLLSLVYMILILVFTEKYRKYFFETMTIEDKKKHITIITLLFVFAMPVGILYLIKYLKDIKNVSNQNENINQNEN